MQIVDIIILMVKDNFARLVELVRLATVLLVNICCVFQNGGRTNNFFR